MKDNSCRRCGHNLEVNKTCNVCSQDTQFNCHKCGYTSEEQIHFQCAMISVDHALLSAQK